MAPDCALMDEIQLTPFQTNAWQSAWTATWGKLASAEPSSYLFPDLGTYITRQKIKNLINVTSGFPLGSPSKNHASIRKEFARYQKPTITKFLTTDCSQFVFTDVILNSLTYQHILDESEKLGHLVVEHDDSVSYSVDTQNGDFDTYLNGLSGSTRHRLYKGRLKLEKKGVLTVENLWPDFDAFIETLNAFHMARWQKSSYSKVNLAMIKTLLPLLEADGHRVELSALKLDRAVISQTLDVFIEGRKFNLQSGFDSRLGGGISPGMIHFGFNIEKSFQEPVTRAYDFMAGTGKHTDYKKHIANQQCTMKSLIVVKDPWLKVFYRMNRLYNKVIVK